MVRFIERPIQFDAKMINALGGSISFQVYSHVEDRQMKTEDRIYPDLECGKNSNVGVIMKKNHVSLYLLWVFFYFLVFPSSGLGQLQEEPSSELLAPPMSASEPAQRRALKQPQYDANDFYYYRGEPVRLHRSLIEYAVRFKAGLSDTKKEGLIRNVTPSGTLSYTADQSTGRAPSIVKLESVNKAEPAKLRADMEEALARLRAEEDVKFAFPIFVYPKTGTKLLLTDEIVLRLNNGRKIEDLASLHKTYGTTVVKKMWGTQDQYVLRVNDPKAVSPLKAANAFFDSGLVQWAVPNFMQQYEKSFIPDDPLFINQWHLDNTGQGGGTADADVDAPEAWDLQQGSPDITIAIIDDGVELSHEDLAPNIFSNPGEVPGNGIDDDGNGFIDDVNGWDFIDNDNDPNPDVAYDSHGTSVAGVAAAHGQNALGVSGVCQNCKIFPIKISKDAVFASDSTIATAIRYAASLADVLNNSWSGGAPMAQIEAAIQDAVTTGRGGKGAVVLAASGNNGEYVRFVPSEVPAGTHRFRWVYSKDLNDLFPKGDDTAWLVWVTFPGGERVDFESGLPGGWMTGGDASWVVVTDPLRSDEGQCIFTHAAKAGAITHNQSTFLEVVKTIPAGDLTYISWVSSETGYDGTSYDGLTVKIDLNNDGDFNLTSNLQSGVDTFDVSFPASVPEAIAVGASSNFDCRSAYSQFGPELDFLAPSCGGTLGIVTTDRSGVAGYDPGNYTPASYPTCFGGTSSATPLAAGVAGLILSHYPNRTQSAVRQHLRNTADKIGPESYVGGRNDRYGFGRINAFEALLAEAPFTLTVTKAGTGSGTVSSSPAGIDCETDCSEDYQSGTIVILTATPDSGSDFTNWSGDSDCADGQVTMDDNKACVATFQILSPQAPSLLTAAAISASQIDLVWADNSGNETGFKIERKTGAGGTYSEIAATGPDVTAYADTGLSASTTYYYRVRAYNAAGDSTYSNEANATTEEESVSGGGGEGGGCFIATAAYGTPMAKEVRYLRAFRDQYLLTNAVGREFVRLYYRYSPPLADYLRKHENLRDMVRIGLLPLAEFSKALVSEEVLKTQTADRP